VEGGKVSMDGFGEENGKRLRLGQCMVSSNSPSRKDSVSAM
jgi:hypothetical protein